MPAWVDCKALDQRDPKRPPLRMQVQRAMVGGARYEAWNRDGRVELPPGTTADQAAAIVMEAIENKRTHASADVILLLDAVRLPWLALGEVITECRRLYSALAEKVVFGAIYVVPWHQSGIVRIDMAE